MLTSQLGMRTRKLETAMQQLSNLGEELRIAKAKLCRAEMNADNMRDLATAACTDRDRHRKLRERFELALRRIGVLVQEPRAALLVKIRAELKEAGL